jgi:hypothetical protein
MNLTVNRFQTTSLPLMKPLLPKPPNPTLKPPATRRCTADINTQPGITPIKTIQQNFTLIIKQMKKFGEMEAKYLKIGQSGGRSASLPLVGEIGTVCGPNRLAQS